MPVGFDLSSYGVRVEPDKRLMAVLATLAMARSLDPKDNGARLIATPLSAKGALFRDELEADNIALPQDLRTKISIFVSQYKKRHQAASDAELVAPFVSMAYALTPAPELADPIITSDLPGDLLDVLDFAPLVREFYRRSTFSSHVEEYVKEYRDGSAKLRDSTREMVSELLDYLHTRPRLVFAEKVKTTVPKAAGKKPTIEKTEIREHERHFYVVSENLTAKGNVNFLNIRDDYYVIVPPDTDLSVSEARRAFLRFVIDPLVLDRAKDIEPMRTWAKPIIDDLRKTNTSISPDVFLSISRSLVAAIDIREAQYLRERIATDQARRRIAALGRENENLDQKRAISAELERYRQGLADEAAQQFYEDYQKGAVFSFYFAEQLKGVEDSGFDIAGSLKEIVLTFDGKREAARVAATADARKRAIAAREERLKHPRDVSAVAANPVTTRLLDIQKMIDAKDYARADADLKALLAQNPGEPRVYYNIGRVAGLVASGLTETEKQSVKLLEAKTAYTNALNSATPDTDKALLSLSYVALARIYEFFDDSAYAMRLYDAAIKLNDMPGGAFQAAIAAKQRLLKPQQ
ncbi:MAG TPA: hypothetical protein VGO43_07565 [Pyrinomonadaceae bacterium]|nr:hypothetical protein [Pyrinomonadaceae bacterium]